MSAASRVCPRRAVRMGAALAALAALAMLALVTAGCAVSGNPSAGGATATAVAPVRVALPSLANLDPFGQNDYQLIELGISEALTTVHPDALGVGMGMLASATRSTPTVWTLTLRPGITFQNGSPVDAAAVVDCLELDAHHAFSSDAVSTATLAVTGPLSFTLTTTTPAGDVPALLGDATQYPIFDVHAYLAAGTDLDSLPQRGIYTGPFEPVSLTATRLVARASPCYWGGPVKLPGLTGLFIDDPQARVAAVQDGQADIAIGVPATAQRALHGDSRAYFVTGRYAPDAALAMLNENPASVLADPVVRQAVRLAINYRSLVTGLGTSVQPAPSIFPSYAPYALSDQVGDPASAKAMLDADGWEPGPDGIRTKDGQPLALSYLWEADDNPVGGDLGLALQQQLKAVGIELTVTQVADLFNAATQPGWGIIVLRIPLEGLGTPASYLSAFLSSTGSANLGSINDPALDSLIAAEAATTNPARRDALLRQLQQVVAEHAEVIVLAQEADGFVVSPAYRELPQTTGYHQVVTADLAPAMNEVALTHARSVPP